MSHHHHHTMGGDDGIIYEDPFSDPTVMKLGDASIASPFIARTPKLSSVLSVIRQVGFDNINVSTNYMATC